MFVRSKFSYSPRILKGFVIYDEDNSNYYSNTKLQKSKRLTTYYFTKTYSLAKIYKSKKVCEKSLSRMPDNEKMIIVSIEDFIVDAHYYCDYSNCFKTARVYKYETDRDFRYFENKADCIKIRNVQIISTMTIKKMSITALQNELETNKNKLGEIENEKF